MTRRRRKKIIKKMHLVLNSFKTLNYLCKLFLGKGERIGCRVPISWVGVFVLFGFYFCFVLFSFFFFFGY